LILGRDSATATMVNVSITARVLAQDMGDLLLEAAPREIAAKHADPVAWP
jgi:hypothetical protein